jgi:hypothetical protein
MAKQLDVYRDWLGITEPARPLNHYQVLKLKLFEDDPETIRANYRKLNAHVRKFSTGEFGPQSQDLLNELAKAMLCLTDAERKSEYDAVLGRTTTQPGRRRTMEQILLAERAITQEQLTKARDFAKAVGMEVRDAILQQRIAAPETVMQAYAESVGRPYLDLADLDIDPALAAKLPAALARQHSCVPVIAEGSQVLVASPLDLNPDVEDAMRLRFGLPARSVFCTPASLNAALAKYYSRDAARGPAPRQPARREAVSEEESEEAAALARERRKRALVIAGLAVSGAFLLYMVYIYLKAILSIIG